MNDYSQIILIQSSLRKTLLSFLVISVLSIFLFWGINYSISPLASLPSVITAWVTINPLEVNLSAPPETEVNEVFWLRAKIINKGKEKIKNGKAEIHLPQGLILIKKDSAQKIGVIPGKKAKNVSWRVRGAEAGIYIVIVRATGELKGEMTSAEDSIKIEVVAAKPQIEEGRQGFFKSFLSFFQKWFED